MGLTKAQMRAEIEREVRADERERIALGTAAGRLMKRASVKAYRCTANPPCHHTGIASEERAGIHDDGSKGHRPMSEATARRTTHRRLITTVAIARDDIEHLPDASKLADFE